jgi:cytochrome b pre-mRNA-processing protein 3
MDYHIMAFAWLNRILGLNNGLSHAAQREKTRPLYAAVVREARLPLWYKDGGVADTIDGRFDVLSLVAAQTLLRLEEFGENGVLTMARFAEVFAEDMEGQLREEGHGDVGVGARVETLVSALGGRLGAVRAVRDGKEQMSDMLTRNLYRGKVMEAPSIAAASAQLAAFSTQLSRLSLEQLVEGRGLTHG